MKKININIDWSVVFWLGLITTFLWFLAKAVGLVHTPLFISIIPYLGSMVVIIAVVKKLGEYVQKIDRTILDIGDIKSELKYINSDMKDLNNKFGSLYKSVAVLESRYN